MKKAFCLTCLLRYSLYQSVLISDRDYPISDNSMTVLIFLQPFSLYQLFVCGPSAREGHCTPLQVTNLLFLSDFS